MNSENEPGPPVDEQYQKMLAEAESLAGQLEEASYPLLARHTSGAQRASLAIEMACTFHLTEAIHAHTAALWNQSEAIRRSRE